jgi:hypothetical protein
VLSPFRLTSALSLTIALAACATPSDLMQARDGSVYRCASAGWGWVGAPLALMAEQRCVDDATKLGYTPYTGPAKPITHSDSATYKPLGGNVKYLSE